MTNPIDILARTIFGESRGEGLQGMNAVANVIMNRVNHPKWWGKDIISVCQTPWQFSCWNASDLNLPVIQEITDSDPIFSQCLKIANDAIAEELPDITNGATSYFDKRMNPPPSWSDGLESTITIGHHIFYKL